MSHHISLNCCGFELVVATRMTPSSYIYEQARDTRQYGNERACTGGKRTLLQVNSDGGLCLDFDVDTWVTIMPLGGPLAMLWARLMPEMNLVEWDLRSVSFQKHAE